MLTRWAPTCAFVMLASSACTAGEEPGPRPSADSPSATSPSAPPSPASPSQTPGPNEIAGEGTPLDPGTYTYSPFEPRVTFELGPGWQGGHTLTEFFDVWRGHRVAVMFARPGFFLDKQGEEVDARGLSPEDALRLLRTRGTATPAPVMRLAGAEAPSITLRTWRRTDLFGSPNGALTAEPAFRYRIAAIEVGGQPVLIIVPARPSLPGTDRRAVDDTLRTISFDA